MGKKLFRMIPLLVVMCLLFSVFTGCTVQNTKEVKTEDDTAQKTGTSETQNTQPVEEEPVKFTILLRASPSFSPENNAWVDEINKKANADIEWFAVPVANVWEKRNVIMASNDYPEVIIMNTTSKGLNDNLYDSMVKNKIILPVDDYIKNTPNIMKYTHESAWEAIRNIDGKVYMVPRCTIIREDFMEIRKDWREKFNMPVPETIDDWFNYFKAVATQDPDGNGEADTYGVSDTNELIASTGTVNLEFFARAWHADKNWYDNGNGEVEYGVFARDGRFKYALDFYRKLMQEKALDPDIMTNKGIGPVVEKLNRGVTAAHRVFAAQKSGIVSDLRLLQPEAKFELVEFPVAPESANYSNEKLVYTNAGIYNGWALTNKAKGKEQRIINVFDWLLSDEGWSILKLGVEGVHYKKDGDKIIVMEPTDTAPKPDGNVQLFRRPNDEDLWLPKPTDDKLEQFGEELLEEYEYKKEWLYKSVNYVKDNYLQKGLMGISLQEEIDFLKKDVYSKELTEITAKIIYGELPLEAWDAYLEKVYSSGWDKVTEEYNKYYKSHK